MKLILTLVAAIGLIAFGYLTIEDRHVRKGMAKDSVNLFIFFIFYMVVVNLKTNILVLQILNIALHLNLIIMFIYLEKNKVVYRIMCAMNLGIIVLYTFIQPDISIKYLVFNAILGLILIYHTTKELYFCYN